MQLAVEELFEARWTAQIHDEWTEALLRSSERPRRAALRRTRELIDVAVSNCLVHNYEPLISTLELPDPDDGHVLAAAITGGCNILVTYNLRHFPKRKVPPHGIEVQHPDDFLYSQLNIAPELFCHVAEKVRSRLTRPPRDIEQYLGTLKNQGLATTAAELASLLSGSRSIG